jgi:hypothetical protein
MSHFDVPSQFDKEVVVFFLHFEGQNMHHFAEMEVLADGHIMVGFAFGGGLRTGFLETGRKPHQGGFEVTVRTTRELLLSE